MTQPGQTSATPVDEGLDQRVVLRAAEARGAVAEVERVGEERRVVGPDVERDRQRQRRMDAAGGGVQRELADRDRHAAGALVAEAEDPLVVGHDDQPDVVVRALAQELGDPVAVGRRDPDAAGPPDDVAELLAGAPDRRRVDDRQELLEVLREQPVEQRRVAVLERRHPDVALERVVLAAQVLELELDLLLDGQDAVGQQAAQPEGVALVVGEGEVLGQQPAAEERRPRQGDRSPAGRRRCRRTGRGGDASSRGYRAPTAPAAPVPSYPSAHDASTTARDPLPPGFRWPDGIRAAAFFSFDMDAEAAMLADHPEVADYLDVIAPPALRPAGRRPAPAADARPARACGRRSSSRAGSPRRGRTSPAASATPATRSATTATSTNRSAAWTRRPRSATSNAAWPRSTRSSASARSATARRRGT